MNNNDRIIAMMGVLHAAYPNFVFQDNTIDVFCMMLHDLDPDLLEQAAKAHLATGKFFPTIAEYQWAVDVHAASMVVGRMMDGAKPQPPQMFKPADCLAWVQKQQSQAEESISWV